MKSVQGSPRLNFQYAAFVGDSEVEGDAESGIDILAIAQDPGIIDGVYLESRVDQFPRMSISYHKPDGVVIQCWEDASSLSFFLVTSDAFSKPSIDIEMGGQALERWPGELFVSDAIAVQAIQHFIDSGKQDPALKWVRIDRFPRIVVWEIGRRSLDD